MGITYGDYLIDSGHYDPPDGYEKPQGCEPCSYPECGCWMSPTPQESRRMVVTDQMVDYALNAWFASPPSETDQGLERSMRAALEAAFHLLSLAEVEAGSGQNEANDAYARGERKQVYCGKNLAGDVLIQAETGGYAPLVTINIHGERHNILYALSPLAAHELSDMLKHAALATVPGSKLETITIVNGT